MNFSKLFQLICIIVFFVGCTSAGQTGSEFYLLAGTYTSGESEGIYVYKFNAEDGSLSYVSSTAGVENPSYLAVSPDQEFVYAVNEVGNDQAAVSAFSFDRDTGTLTFLNKQSSGGGGPCYVSVDKTGTMVFAGNYSGGSLSMLPVNEDGSLGEAEVIIQHQGSSVNEHRQGSPHVHCTFVSPDNRYLFVADLGTDRVAQYAISAGERTLSSEPSSYYEAEPGAGPRHITFHPNGKFVYLINELNGTVVAFHYEYEALHPVQTISTLPEEYEGQISGADIHVSPDGKFLYVSNREDLNSIASYSIDQETGELTYLGQQSSGGVHPRNFMIDPTGQYLLVANRNTNNIVVFKRNKTTGELTPTGTEIKLSMPVCLKMIPVN